MQLALRGEGEGGQPGAPRGDLIVEIQVKPHPLFQRDGDNLICQVPITFSQAALGGIIEVPTLDGPLEHELKRGLQSGEAVRIPGKGMPNFRSKRQGDLIVIVVVETPRHLTNRQEELFRELAELDERHVSAERKSFFEKIRDFFTNHESNSEEKSEKK
jgi:molecular chaperone DnaJ